ncbi:alcohol dehydrogenase [Zobellella endophytica]|uniref:Alcohol dehydrogenase n=2 Tax=Zobellella endophytica TaxID=2116700 RepID=A0A2P7R504_9GAMM|nr:alcohol dehydrogenase [Zobellella endophytica]
MMKDWKKVLLSPEHTIRDALTIINSEALRVAVVVDGQHHLLGLITDGDIRRALLNNATLESSVEQVMNPNPITAAAGTGKKELVALMQRYSILSVPLIDQDGRLESLESLEEALKPSNYNNPVFIMAGGFGTRLRPLTDHCPKPMLKVGERPILEILLLTFIRSGFSNFYISTHYMPEQIEAYFGDGALWGVNITYVHEEVPLGTGGALGLLPENIPELPLIMINGDVLTTVDFERLLEFHNQHDAIATMCVREYDYQIPYGVVSGDGHRITHMEEKPVQRFFVNAGIYVVDPELYRAVPSQHRIDMPSLLEKQLEDGKDVLMFPIHEYWLDIGRMDDFHKAQLDVKGLFQ